MTSPFEALRKDSYLGPVVDRHGRLDLEPADDMFERLVVSILRQQVSMASAAATRERLYDTVEISPDGILATEPETLRDVGLSRQKTEYVRNVAEAFREEYNKAYFEELDDATVVDELTSITGIGEWTANMQLLFSLGRPDVFPVGDLGIRKGMRTLYDEELTRAEMVDEAERWAPYRSYASLHLWRIEEGDETSVDEVVEE